MEQKSKKKIYIIILAAAAVAALILAAYMIGARSAASQNASGIVVEKDASEWDKDLENVAGKEDSGIKIPGYGQLTVEAGEKNWQITLANPKDNHCYFKYNITIGEDGPSIYESDYIEPGKAVKEFEVSDALDAGEYDMYLNIATYSMDEEHTRLNGASVKADLLVVGE